MSNHSQTGKFILLTFFGLFSGMQLFAQEYEPENGAHDPKNTTYVLTGCKIVVSADKTLPIGMLVVQNGRIKNVGIVEIPPTDAVIVKLKGFTIYPSFIDMYSSSGIKAEKPKGGNGYPQLESLKKGPYYWNQAIHPETNAYELFDNAELKDKDDYLKAGFGAISTHNGDGIMRGTSVLMALNNLNEKENVLKTEAANHYSFSRGSSRQTYPSSQMGAIALIRQFYYDAFWYDSLKDIHKENISLQSGLDNMKLPQVFGLSTKLEVLRAANIAKEFGFNLIAKGGGDEFERASEIKASGASLILPVNFPEPYDMSDPYTSRYVSMMDLKRWEMGPYNPYIMYRAGVQFAFTTDGLKKKSDFLKNVKKAIEHGLPQEEALRSLTETPAKLLGVEDMIGTLENGKLANFLVVKGDLFNGGEIFENWSNGDRIRFKDVNAEDLNGTYDLNLKNIVYELKVSGEIDKPKAIINVYEIKTDALGASKMDTTVVKCDLAFEGLQLSLSFETHDKNYDGIIQLNGSYHPGLGVLEGTGTLPDGKWIDWVAVKSKEKKKKEKDKKEIEVDTSRVNNIYYPNLSYGFDELPKKQTFYIKNATVWTNEEVGILENASVTIRDGKIVAVNSGGAPGGAIVIDAKGKHVTCGIIDEHSHIAISKGVNEGGQAISAEVSIADVVRSNDINIYRQLAGGVTAAQLLHGSANPIGGQSALIKLKWGFNPEEMLINDSLTDGFIKFALGENVKQANWGDKNVIRFPQTRLGVEQVYYDAFLRAKEYKKEWTKYNRLKIGPPPRRDLELEALAEILDKKRFITCHSYQQGEINMLMKVADSMGFTINTFTHILEGYKVADKMAAHGAGGSTFADWWAYKYEVKEAIPYNAAILQQMGVVTAINSDDAEMGRRLNQEAAKAVKYGGISEIEAWKMVTLNPAKLLHLDDRMGSIKVGKDADIVIWSDNPLSINAKVEKTIVDGILLYDWEKNYELQQRDELERKRIMGMMLEEKKNGGSTRKPVMRKNPQYHCDSEGE
ncbi:amidohydrolase family protein [Paracrocinitomix mangrovi]|uniref:amidohydrolase family protein n=1 Tax=Paracrocinitomix mangrovi TaxID=2862509 RepID=UPI001EDA1B9E|nr:amidohydrolase family protein [Paracrocinitomix mangrovi]UKN03824.1 amidohydrolase family protein [Paracrocinitomix mangrovi]